MTHGRLRSRWFPLVLVLVAAAWGWADVVGLADQRGQRGRGGRGGDPLAEPFRGVTTDGTVTPGLFPISATGVSTAPVREAAEAFIASLTPEQRAGTVYPVDDNEWRLWNNVHRYARQGVSFATMNDAQRERGFAMMRAGLSAKGFERSRNVMRLNGYLAELVNNFDEYGEFLYHLTVMGTPSATEPWGWQLDGHHLVVNYFVLGDQVVMTPTFMGSEPTEATAGQYAGAVVMKDEETRGLAFMRSLSAEQRQEATISPDKTRNSIQAQAFSDNVVLAYQGLQGSALSASQRQGLLAVAAEFIGNMDDGHAAVRMAEIESHLDDTWFSWVGGTGDDDVFYYRIQSPVVLIEFDHQSPVALPGERVPGKNHVHAVVRTPNGNDYGKDLLRQHLQRLSHASAYGVAR